MIDLPASHAHPLRIGKTGKERNIELGLTEPGRHLLQLQLLGWRAPGFSIETRPSVQCLRSGWVRLDADAIAAPEVSWRKVCPMIEQVGLRKLWRTESKVDTALVVRRLGSA